MRTVADGERGVLQAGQQWYWTVRLVASFVAMLALASLSATPIAAEPVSGRVLRAVETQVGPDRAELRIRFRIPVRYVRHTPVSRGDSVEIELSALSQGEDALLTAVRREALQPPRAAGLAIEAIVLQNDRRDGPILRIDFERSTGFEVRQGEDLRSIVVTLAAGRVTPRRFAVQLAASPSATGLPEIPAALLEDGEEPLVMRFERDGVAWERLRVGPFPTIRAARIARDRLEPHFPGAFVVELRDRPTAAPRAEGPLPAPIIADAAPRSGDGAASEPEAAPGPQTAPSEATTPPAPIAKTPPPKASPETEARAARLLDEARRALTDGELDRGIALLTRIGSLAENGASADAQELLGVARERKGQRAHAKAEYETYLERYPDDDGAPRVRQRLDALLTARAEPAPALREPEVEPDASGPLGSDWEVFGSLSTSYRRDVRRSDGFGRVVTDSSFLNDVFVAARGTVSGWDFGSELSGSYLWDLTNDGDDVPRTNTLFLEASDPDGPFAFSLGRQTGNTAGIIGRFDGARLFYRLDPVWTVSLTGGLPVEPFVTNGLQTDKGFVGVAADATGIVENLDLQLFAIHQRAGGFTDRTAIGTEFRWVIDRLFIAGLVDVDVLYGELNTAFLVGNWQISEDTNLNALLDYRNVPQLTTSNALLGQLDADDLGDLEDRFSRRDIEGLAEDRTFRSALASFGITHRVSDTWQIATDLTVSNLSGTPESGGVPAFEGSGTQTDLFLQWIGTGLFFDRDVSRIGIRYVDAELVNTSGLLLSSRFPWRRRWRFNPLLDLLYRDPAGTSGVFVVRPGLRLDYRLGRITFDLESSYEWSFGERFLGAGDEEGFTGARRRPLRLLAPRPRCRSVAAVLP